MLIIISPAKTLDFKTAVPDVPVTVPDYLHKSRQLASELRKLNPAHLSKLMNISPKLAQLNYERYQEWNLDKTTENSKPAVFAFKGAVYTGLDISRFSDEDLLYAQNHLRILSGLHGILKPLDIIQPYRLEMGTKLIVNDKKNLYEFWADTITPGLQKALINQDDDILINLASEEYFKSINTKKLKAKIITPVFKDFKNGTYKFLSIYGKKARGMMTRYILMNRIKDIDDLMLFEEEGYFYNDKLSEQGQLVFTRG